MAPRFDTDFDPRHGETVVVSPLLRRIVCRNPSKYTFHGTGTYIVGRGSVAVVDPGPDPAHDDAAAAHADALLGAVADETVDAVLVTHTHGDHSPAAAHVAAATGAPVLGFGPHPRTATSEGDDDPAEDDDDTSPSAHPADVDFRPDRRLAHGDVVTGPGWTIEALHTPGHISNHLCFALVERGMLFTGDHVMGWSTTIIPPPDGDMTAYLASLELVLDRPETVLVPTHGPLITEPRAFVRALIEHRLARERAIVDQLALGPRTVADIVAVLYADVDEALHQPAARYVTAHLESLATLGRATATSHPDPDPTWHLTP